MDRLALDQGWLQKVAGLVAGILIGFVLGPLSFIPLGVPFAAAASFGCLAGAVAGYFTVSLLVHRRKAAIDRELESAISAVRVEAGCRIPSRS